MSDKVLDESTALLEQFANREYEHGWETTLETDQFEPGQLQQLRRDQRQGDPHHDRRTRSDEDRLLLLLGRQRAGGQRDDDRVVAGQQDVDPDDLAKGQPEGSRAEFHHSPERPAPMRPAGTSNSPVKGAIVRRKTRLG